MVRVRGCFKKRFSRSKPSNVKFKGGPDRPLPMDSVRRCFKKRFSRSQSSNAKFSGGPELFTKQHSTGSKLSKQELTVGETSQMFGLARVFSFEEIEEATNSFVRMIGVGGLGAVYHGKLRDGQEVAVKVLHRYSLRQLEQFSAAVSVFYGFRHQNLVTLYGCTEIRHEVLVLVYEFVPNSTVADHLHGLGSVLPWAVRIQIAIETAEALVYLHNAEPAIVHGDVNTSNILLDHNCHVKISDLGESYLLPWRAKYSSFSALGTMGYRDPDSEFYRKQTLKSDVYSFGVVLLELISGQWAVDFSRDEIYLSSMGTGKIINKKLDELVDPKLGYHSNGDVSRMINSVAKLACKCLQPKSNLRPPIIEVLEVLKRIKPGRQYIPGGEKGSNEIEVEGTIQTSQDIIEGSKKVNVKGKKHEKQQTPVKQKGLKDLGKQRTPVKEEGLKDLDLKVIKFRKQQTDGGHIIVEEDAKGVQPEGIVVKGTKREKERLSYEYKSPKELDNIGEVRVFSYEELQKATNNFDTSIKPVNDRSRGVYLGKLQDGQLVAVKVLTDPHSRFFKDVNILARIRHDNLVTLYGCTEPHDQELLLVYEFMPNGSIADHLHGQQPTLTWDVRIEIALETAQAVEYLHTHEPPIIYHDLNTCNILVDNAFHAKLANLSESRLLPLDIKQASTMPDTMAYQNPEDDVYSFGMVLLELISGELVGDIALKSISNKELEILVDPEPEYDFSHKVRTMVDSVSELAARCINKKSNLRPRMLEVVAELKRIKDEMKQKHAEDKGLIVEEEGEVVNVLGLLLHEEIHHAIDYWQPPREIDYGGGLNNVYLGKFRDFREVAVKVVKDRNVERLKGIINEVNVVSHRPHKNLLTFYGHTSPVSNQDMLLVCEYVKFIGTVADLIQRKQLYPSWDLRIQIAIETAEALTHLHFDCGKRIIHGYVNTSSILLDSLFRVKVSCLGRYDLLTIPEDTDGYREPGCNENDTLTETNDIYSFGLVLVELLSGKPAVEVFPDTGGSHLVDDALNKMIKEGLELIVDPMVEYVTNSEVSRRIKSVAELACRCLNKEMRPSMREVVTVLKEIKGVDVASNSIKGEVFTYEQLRVVTKSFRTSRELGRDFFDRTYFGVLRDERKVAVKLLAHRTVEILEPLFKEVMANIAGHRHENLATVYGCTDPRPGVMFLVHEYVPNGTLEYYLHNKRGTSRTSFLQRKYILKQKRQVARDWFLRFQIATETAKALSYLHSQEPPIIHGSLTAYNILFDESFHVKVSGVNLFISKSLEGAGHFCKDGYRDPMYKFRGLPTEKVDVFSFGVVLFELISGLQAVDSNQDRTSIYLYNMGLKKMLNQEMDQFVDKRLGYHSDVDKKRMINSVADLARMCLHMKQNMRPTMMEILSALEEIKSRSNR